MKKLTAKQSQFVIEYLVDLNATQAAIRAGYSEDTAGAIGAENLEKPQIKNAIEEQMDCRSKRTMITADWVLSSMREVAERCMQAKPVMVYNKEEKQFEQATALVEKESGERVEEGIWEFDSGGANKALENLAKHLKLLTDKIDHSGIPSNSTPIINIYGNKDAGNITNRLLHTNESNSSP